MNKAPSGGEPDGAWAECRNMGDYLPVLRIPETKQKRKENPVEGKEKDFRLIFLASSSS